MEMGFEMEWKKREISTGGRLWGKKQQEGRLREEKQTNQQGEEEINLEWVTGRKEKETKRNVTEQKRFSSYS
jgi:hypothetical protein